MTFKRAVYASTLAAGVGLAGLFGAGLGTASADPGGQCNAPNRPPCGQDQHNDQRDQNNGQRDQNNGQRDQNNNQWGQNNNNDNNGPQGGQIDWHGRGVDQGRQDHQPFNWNGQQVQPMPAGNGAGWGFWFLGMWIPL